MVVIRVWLVDWTLGSLYRLGQASTRVCLIHRKGVGWWMEGGHGHGKGEGWWMEGRHGQRREAHRV